MNFIQTEMEEKQVACLFLDLKKVYDNVQHEILFKKFKKIGIIDKPLKLLKSFHENRKQFVEILEEKSELKTIKMGLAQGSILSAQEFCIYINDIFNIKIHGTLQMYADDAVIMYSNKNTKEIIKQMEEDTKKIIE